MSCQDMVTYHGSLGVASGLQRENIMVQQKHMTCHEY